MQKSIVKILLLICTTALISGFTIIETFDLQQQRDPSKKKLKELQKSMEVNKTKDAKIKKELDTIKKDNTIVSQKEVIIDTLSYEKGNFKFFKSKAHVSYYAERFHGQRTASGKRFDMNKMTAAHKKLPFGTMVRVTNEANGKSVIVEITDRGPFVKGREIDLSKKAFMSITSGKSSGYVIATLEVLQK